MSPEMGHPRYQYGLVTARRDITLDGQDTHPTVGRGDAQGLRDVRVAPPMKRIAAAAYPWVKVRLYAMLSPMCSRDFLSPQGMELYVSQRPVGAVPVALLLVIAAAARAPSPTTKKAPVEARRPWPTRRDGRAVSGSARVRC